MDDSQHAEASQYANVLDTLTEENDTDSSLCHSLVESGASYTTDVQMDDLNLVAENVSLSDRITSRIISNELNCISTSRQLSINAEDLLQENCQMEETIGFKESSLLNDVTQIKSFKSKAKSIDDSELDRPIKKANLNHVIYPKIDNDVFTLSKVSCLGNNEVNNILNLAVNALPLQSTNNTAVEQPNIGPCSCFICGHILVDPGERFSYLRSQKLFSMQMSLLQLLSNIVNQTVITNTDSVDLCPKCSELMNEIDIAYKHLHDLKQQITKLFNINKRPKLTFHVLPKPACVSPKSQIITQNNNKLTEMSLAELAFTRPRRGRGCKKIASNKIKKSCKTPIMGSENPVKRKGGRPRKPFQCNICRRKFLTQSMINSHMVKEHNWTPSQSLPPLSLPSHKILLTKENLRGALNEVKVEASEDKECSENLDSNVEKKPVLSANFSLQTKSPPIDQLNLSVTTMRPIQPKPKTVVQTGSDGTLIFYMSPATAESSPTLIKVSPGYLNLKTESHSCELCNKAFLDEKSYRMHRIAAHGTRKRRADEEANETISVIVEEKKEPFDKVWECSLCEAVFSSKKLLTEHKRAVHVRVSSVPKDARCEKLYSCEHCSQIFNFKYEIERHRESHLPFNQVGPHEFVCCICGLKVASKAALKIHLHRFHSKEEETKDFLCAECGYMTSTKKAFSDHLRVHSDSQGQKTQCNLCSKEMLPSSFKIHMLRMHGEAKYPCDNCGQKFTVRSDLMRHLNTIHSSLRPYDCSLCGEKFVTSEALRYHKNKVHSTVFYFCEICGKSYKWKGELRTHMNRCHNEPKTRYQCSLCPRSYADRKKLRHHMMNKHDVSRELADMMNKHEVSRELTYYRNYRPDEEKETTFKLDENEIVSSGYEPQGTIMTSPQTVMSSHPCSSTNHTEGHESHNLVSQSHDTVLTNLQAYEHPDHNTLTLTTLQSHMSTDHQTRSLSHHQDHTQYHNHNPIQQTHVQNGHNLNLLSHSHHQTLHSPHTSHPQQQQHHHQHQHQHIATQSQDSLSGVESIYIVPDMHMTIQEDEVTNS